MAAIDSCPSPEEGPFHSQQMEMIRPQGADLDRGEDALPAAPRISLEAEVPEVLFDGMREFLNHHPNWDQGSVITSALAGFLFQNGCNDRWVSSFYLDRIFQLTTTEKRG